MHKFVLTRISISKFSCSTLSNTFQNSFDSNGSPPVIVKCFRLCFNPPSHHFQNASLYGFTSLFGIGSLLIKLGNPSMSPYCCISSAHRLLFCGPQYEHLKLHVRSNAISKCTGLCVNFSATVNVFIRL